jgi:RHH-type proline utilization regulon transcriptional repressor/proline dehydrogenase/delta 1-pyrroline-5-carboxylate dehydrogenase
VNNPRLWSPGIKLGVREGSFTHVTELFGPLLAVMRADDLSHALRIVNGTPYGLTSGLFSLDEREQAFWQARVRAGNLYVNRPITGAIVRRQPFGGVKASSVGPGAKAGGPDYALQLVRVEQREPPKVEGPPTPAAAAFLVHVRKHLLPPARERLSTAACSYGHAQRTWFGVDHDPSAVPGERNVLRYQPCAPLLVRAGAGADPLEVLLATTAAITATASFTLSVDPALAARVPVLSALPEVSVVVEDTSAALARIAPELDRVRSVGPVEPALSEAAGAALVHLTAGPVLLSGRLELLAYHREQSVSHRYHRYGNLTPSRLLPPLRGVTKPEA